MHSVLATVVIHCNELDYKKKLHVFILCFLQLYRNNNWTAHLIIDKTFVYEIQAILISKVSIGNSMKKVTFTETTCMLSSCKAQKKMWKIPIFTACNRLLAVKFQFNTTHNFLQVALYFRGFGQFLLIIGSKKGSFKVFSVGIWR